MKKILIMSLVLTVFSTTFFTSCVNDEEPQITITDQLIDDQTFTNAAEATVDLVVIAQESNWMLNGESIQELMRKSASDGLSVEEEGQLTALLGMDRLAYTQVMTDFGTSINDLLVKYPQLNELSASERQALFSSAIAQNDDLAAYMTEIYAHGRMCFLQDLCNLAVDLAVLIGGPLLCDIIAGAIPVIGPILCSIVLDIATDLAVGICNGLPC